MSEMIAVNNVRISKRFPEELRVIPSVAITIAKSLGIKCAAGYLRNNGFSLESSLWILLRISLKE